MTKSQQPQRRILIPLDLASPSTDHLAVRRFMEWAMDNILRSDDIVVLLTVIIPPKHSPVFQSISNAIVKSLGWLSGESLPASSPFHCDELCASLVEESQHKLDQISSILRDQVNVFSVETLVEVSSNSSSAYEPLKEAIQSKRIAPDMVILYEKTDKKKLSVSNQLIRKFTSSDAKSQPAFIVFLLS